MKSPLTVGLALCVGAVAGSLLTLSSGVWADRGSASRTVAVETHAPSGSAALPWPDSRWLAEVLQRVRENYVDGVDDHRLMRQAARGMVESLDEHSTVLDARDYAQLLANTSGAYAGIGVEVAGVAGGLRLLRCLPGAAAQRGGLQAGDLLLRIDGLAVSAANLDAALDALRGPVGSPVRLLVLRQTGAPREYTLRRTAVALPSVAAETLSPGYAYLRISEFTHATAGEVSTALARLRADSGAGLRGLIIDLRDNPGGVLEAASAVADEFLDQGTIVSADGRASDARFNIQATPGELIPGTPIAVLVNGGSASAAEILAAALRQNGRATLVGRKTYGKGTVQTIIPLSDGEALKLTTSRYYTPTGASINGVGIVPDVVLSGAEAPPAALDALDRQPTLATRDAEVGVALTTLRGAHYARRGARRADPTTRW